MTIWTDDSINLPSRKGITVISPSKGIVYEYKPDLYTIRGEDQQRSWAKEPNYASNITSPTLDWESTVVESGTGTTATNHPLVSENYIVSRPGQVWDRRTESNFLTSNDIPGRVSMIATQGRGESDVLITASPSDIHAIKLYGDGETPSHETIWTLNNVRREANMLFYDGNLFKHDPNDSISQNESFLNKVDVSEPALLDTLKTPFVNAINPMLYEDKVLLSDQDYLAGIGEDMLVDAESMTFEWTNTTNKGRNRIPCSYDGAYYIGARPSNEAVDKRDAETGSLLASASTSTSRFSSPVHMTAGATNTQGDIVVSHPGLGSTDALDILDTDLNVISQAAPITDPDLAYSPLIDGDIIITPYENVLRGIDPSTGSEVWSVNAPLVDTGSPSVANEKIFVFYSDVNTATTTLRVYK